MAHLVMSIWHLLTGQNYSIGLHLCQRERERQTELYRRRVNASCFIRATVKFDTSWPNLNHENRYFWPHSWPLKIMSICSFFHKIHRCRVQTGLSTVTMAIVTHYNNSDTFWKSQMAFLIVNMHGFSDTV